MFQIIFYSHAFSTVMMTLIIWYIQLVRYPFFSKVPPQDFKSFHARHMKVITWWVAPPMAIELVGGMCLLYYFQNQEMFIPSLIGMILIGIIWLSTAFLQVPLHKRLIEGFEKKTHDHLVATNWIRTLSWSVRFCLVIWMAMQID